LAPLALAALGERGLLQAGPEPLSAALLEAGPDRADLAVTDGGRLVLARALATANTQAWQAAQGDEAARARLLSNLSRDLKISLLRGQMVRLGIAAAVLLVLGLFLGTARLSSLHGQASAYDEAVCSATKRILGTCLTDYRQAVAQLSGGKSRAAGIPRVSAAEILAELVARMPEGSTTLLDDVEVTTTAVRMKGTAESFGKVDEIIAALKKDKCF